MQPVDFAPAIRALKNIPPPSSTPRRALPAATPPVQSASSSTAAAQESFAAAAPTSGWPLGPGAAISPLMAGYISANPHRFQPVTLPANPPPPSPQPPGPGCPTTRCEAPPASPDDAGLRPPSKPVIEGPNEFTLGIDGPDPQLAVGGTHDQQEHQRDVLLALGLRGGLSFLSRSMPARVPPDSDVSALLGQLQPNPPVGEGVTRAVYQSQIPNATPEQALDHVLSNPNQVFNAGGMEIRPATSQLQDGGRYMLEVAGPPPTWLPIQISVDRANNAFTIQTLDGHVLRGEQTFTFTSDCQGGTTLTQDARFQASTQLVGDAQRFAPIAQAQHDAWNEAHREIYEEFNGNRNYEGMGLDLDPHQLGAVAIGMLTHPGAVKDVLGEVANEVVDEVGRFAQFLISGAGHLTNQGLDFAGNAADAGLGAAGETADDVLDWLHIPGGDQVEQGAKAVGGAVDHALDTAGDAIEDGAEWAGDQVRNGLDKVGDFISARVL